MVGRLTFRIFRTLGVPRPEAPGDSFTPEKFILARTHEKNIPPRTKEPFSLESLILGLKFSFSIENFNPGPCFFCGQRGAQNEKTILD